MKLSSLYTNKDEYFEPIQFNQGLNVILGEIRDPKNRDRSTHNLGKTTLTRVIDFCLCRSVDRHFFLKKHLSIFKDFVFYLEIELTDGSYVTVRRSVAKSSKLSFLRHDIPQRRFANEPSASWNHENVGFDTGKQILDGILGLTVIEPWDFRMPVSYALRTQQDFGDVFQLSKHVGKHRYWKPYVAHVLGFNSKLIEEGYDLEEGIDKQRNEVATLTLELRLDNIDLDFIRGLIDIKKAEVDEYETMVNDFDFEIQDSQLNDELVQKLDGEIASLNEMKYLMTSKRRKILSSLELENIQFRPAIAKKLFEEAGVVFPDQIKKDLSDLVRFNKEISKERVEYLKEELVDLNISIRSAADRLSEMNTTRKTELNALGDNEFVSKFRHLTENLVTRKNELFSLERQRDMLEDVDRKNKMIKDLVRELEDHVDDIRIDINDNSSNARGKYARIKKELRKICTSLVGHKAIIATKLNSHGHLEFDAGYLDAQDVATSEASGKSFKQILCAAYDLAVTKVLIDEKYIRFVYHDGLLEGLDYRTKLNVIETLREISDIGVQQILTVIDSDLPLNEFGESFQFEPEEIVLSLHDQGIRGKLFKHTTW